MDRVTRALGRRGLWIAIRASLWLADRAGFALCAIRLNEALIAAGARGVGPTGWDDSAWHGDPDEASGPRSASS